MDSRTQQVSLLEPFLTDLLHFFHPSIICQLLPSICADQYFDPFIHHFMSSPASLPVVMSENKTKAAPEISPSLTT